MKSRAFSLIEILVAVALLAIIGALLVQVTSAIGRSIKISNQAVDAAAQARLAFDRIGMDLASAVIRPDADFFASNSSTNLLSFLSTISSADPAAGFDNRRISLVAYQLAPIGTANPANTGLVRAGKAIGWNSGYTGFMGMSTNTNCPVSFTSSDFPSALAVGAADFDGLSPAVLHAVVGFQLHPDGQPAVLADGTSVSSAAGQIVYSPPVRAPTAPGNSYVDPARISALIIGLAVIDPDKMKLLEPAAAQALSQQLSDLPAMDELPVAKWMAKTQNLASLPASVPAPVREAIRFYQRFFPISPYGGNPQ